MQIDKTGFRKSGWTTQMFDTPALYAGKAAQVLSNPGLAKFVQATEESEAKIIDFIHNGEAKEMSVEETCRHFTRIVTAIQVKTEILVKSGVDEAKADAWLNEVLSGQGKAALEVTATSDPTTFGKNIPGVRALLEEAAQPKACKTAGQDPAVLLIKAKTYLQELAADMETYDKFRRGVAEAMGNFAQGVVQAKKARREAEILAATQVLEESMQLDHLKPRKASDPQFPGAVAAACSAFFKEKTKVAPENVADILLVDLRALGSLRRSLCESALALAGHWPQSVKLVSLPAVPRRRFTIARRGQAAGTAPEEDSETDEAAGPPEEQAEPGELPEVPQHAETRPSLAERRRQLSKDLRWVRNAVEANKQHYDAHFSVFMERPQQLPGKDPVGRTRNFCLCVPASA